MESYYAVSAEIHLSREETIQDWTSYPQEFDGDEGFLEEFDGYLHMLDRIVEDPTNTIYMLYPNGHSTNAAYPYPGEYEPYANATEVKAPESEEPVKRPRKYVRRNKTDGTTSPKGSSSSSSRAGSSSNSTLRSPKKATAPRKPATTTSASSLSARKTRVREEPRYSVCKVPSPLKKTTLPW